MEEAWESVRAICTEKKCIIFTFSHQNQKKKKEDKEKGVSQFLQRPLFISCIFQKNYFSIFLTAKAAEQAGQSQ